MNEVWGRCCRGRGEEEVWWGMEVSGGIVGEVAEFDFGGDSPGVMEKFEGIAKVGSGSHLLWKEEFIDWDGLSLGETLIITS